MSDVSLTRKELHDLVWQMPLTKLSKKYAISDNGLRKICKKHSIPLPKLGHWQKLQYGKKVNIIKLPKIENDTIKIELGIRKEGEKDNYSHLSEYYKLNKEIENDESLNLIVPEKLTKSDPLIVLTRKDLKDKSPSNWHNSNGLVVSSTDVLNVEVSKSNISRALRFINSLIVVLRQRGYNLIVENKKTYALVNNEKLELRCRESLKKVLREDTRWESYDFVPSGILKLKLENTYPDKEWKDGKQKKLEDQLPNILTTLELRSKDEKRKRAEREEWNRQYEIKRQKEKELKQRRNDELKNFKKLFNSSDLLHKANVMRTYISTVEDNALKKGKLSQELKDWIKWANKKADWIDPLTDIENDELLGNFDEDYLSHKPKYPWS